jgi:diaminobutyrate-2-oxoglutarate transaminase
MGSLGPKNRWAPCSATACNSCRSLTTTVARSVSAAQPIANLSYLENLLNDPEAGVQLPAAVIVEAVQGEGG